MPPLLLMFRPRGKPVSLKARVPPVASLAWIDSDTSSPSVPDCNPGSVIVTAGATVQTRVWLALAPLGSVAVSVTT